MSGVLRGLAVVLVLTLPQLAAGHGLHWSSTRSVAHYYPVPVPWAPALSVGVFSPPAILVAPFPCVSAIPSTTGSAYAVPVPAPPSGSPLLPGTVEPSMPRIPEVSESHSASSAYYDSYPLALRDGQRAASTAPSVRVWNLSGRDLSIRVEGRTQAVRPGQNVRLTVPRQFVWEVVGREPQSERIPDAEMGLEIIVRR